MTNFIKEQDWKSIYDLNLNETIWKGGIWIKRVPWWWLYLFSDLTNDIITASTFVTYNEEFKIDQKIMRHYELFKDPNYYDLYCVRDKEDITFNSRTSWHFQSKDDAEQFLNLLTKVK